MKKFLIALLVVGNLFFTSVANAEIKTYEGVGEYLMSDFETFDVAQQRAKQRAEQNACEQAGVYVESRTEVRNAQVTKDEIITMTRGILKILDVQFKREFVDDTTTRIRATVIAQIDSDDVTKWLNKSSQERETLVAQNEALRQSIAEQDKQIAELKQQLADVKTQADRDRMTQAFAAEDKIFLAHQKYEEAKRFYEQGDYNSAIVSFTQVIELTPDNAQAHYMRGSSYDKLHEYAQAISNYSKAIQFSPRDRNWYYSCRGTAYFKLGNYNYAISDFSEAIRIWNNDPRFKHMSFVSYPPQEDYYNRGRVYFVLGNYNQAILDFSMAIEIRPEFVEAYVARGYCYMKLKDWEKSADDLVEATKLGWTTSDIETFLNEFKKSS